jgi:pimeloyl-ACP methyl ester carboxylesterase
MSRTIHVLLLSSMLAGCAGASMRPAQPQSTVPIDTMIDVGGHRLHFRVWQRRSDVTLVFENGGGANVSAWGRVPAMAAARFPLRIVGYDRAGLGSSEVGPFDLTPPQEIQQLARGLDRLRADRIVLIGHSYGGLLALYHAFRSPERVAGLILVDPMNPVFIQRMTLDWLNRTVPDVPHPASPRDTVINRMKRTIADLVARTEPATLAMRVPTVVISAGLPFWNDAAADRAWRESHQAFTAAAPGRHLVVATRSTHGIPETEPELIIQAIEQVLSLENQ